MTPELIDEFTSYAQQTLTITKELDLHNVINESLLLLDDNYREAVFVSVCDEKGNEHPFVDDAINYFKNQLPEPLASYPMIDEELSEIIIPVIMLARVNS